jgi:hypothetical protein
MPLPLDFVLSSDDYSVDEMASEQLGSEHNVNYAYCISSLIYLAMTRTDIIHAVNKLAKFSRHPGIHHFEALLCTIATLGSSYIANLDDAPLIKMLCSQNIQQYHPLFGFSDSSWNDVIDSNHSTASFIITCMGSVVDICVILLPCHLQRQNIMRDASLLWLPAICECYCARWRM